MPRRAGAGRPQWSTAAHRALEDRTLALMDTLAARPAPAIDRGGGGGRAGRQRRAWGTIRWPRCGCWPVRVAACGPCCRPAGYGKTTMLHTAAQAAAADGRPVVAVATTAKAVAELAGAGLDAKTIARLRIDLTDGPLAAGTVVVLDEISQTPTAEVEAVLAAVDACPGGSIWVLGDPRQSQPVGAGGAADHIEQLATAGLIPSARLTVNRRQVDAADREALDLLRRGDPAGIPSSCGPSRGGSTSTPARPQTRQAMAEAVCDDIDRYGAEQVAALVVSHADAEDLADRIRARLADSGQLDRAVDDRPGLDRRAGVPGRGPGAAARPLRPVGQPAGQRHHRHRHPGRHRRADRPPRQRRRRGAAAGRLRGRRPQGRRTQPVPRLGPHRRRGPGRHLGGLPPAGQLRPGRLPGLHRPVPLPPAHPHLEHHPGRPSSTTAGSSPTSATAPSR